MKLVGPEVCGPSRDVHLEAATLQLQAEVIAELNAIAGSPRQGAVQTKSAPNSARNS
jgi:hypothetical protein